MGFQRNGFQKNGYQVSALTQAVKLFVRVMGRAITRVRTR